MVSAGSAAIGWLILAFTVPFFAEEKREPVRRGDVSGLEEPGLTAGSIGPDVLVSIVQAPSPSQPANGFGNYQGISSFSIGTVSCNVGDADLRWEQFTSRHPVIAQNMFRWKNGRFEQVGMSWVKHGFLATNDSGNECGTCQPPVGTSRLGPRCSDVYSAGLNADRRLTGPRSEINAFTGVFPYPHSVCPEVTPIDGRLQVHNEDLDPTMNAGARYVAEGHYVTADDAQAGNGENNASWREITVHYTANDDFYRIARVENASTRQGEPGIYAWREFDSAVEIIPARVVAEGLFLVGVRAYELGTGFWRYEYAVHNLNSHRSGATFRVPIPDGAILNNVGFHDVDYHTGEPYDLTDWDVAVGDGEIMWSTVPFSVNPNANALRWGTLYNFRFDINAEPTVSTLRIGLFRPGVPDEVIFNATGPHLDLIDCNRNTLPDLCDLDCGEIGGECDLSGCGLSIDCNGNGVPDECEHDCNGNGIADSCDIAGGFSMDCQPNGIPDECEPDCDGDGIPDSCDGSDLDMDGIIDCDDLCPETTPAGACICPESGDCCFPAFMICIPDFPALQCVQAGGEPECFGSPCRDGCLMGDADGNGVREFRDFAELQMCFSGSEGEPGFVPPSEDCLRIFDKDDDGDVDSADFAWFHSMMFKS